ncbi:hypothetical protein N9Y89_01395 [bacterium]|nr:hypothetical protein [bacterium]
MAKRHEDLILYKTYTPKQRQNHKILLRTSRIKPFLKVQSMDYDFSSQHFSQRALRR